MSLPRWIKNLRGPWVQNDPHPEPSTLDRLDGVGRGPLADWDATRPVGEVPPMTDEQADRLWADVMHPEARALRAELDRGTCHLCDYRAPAGFEVLNHVTRDGMAPVHYSRTLAAGAPAYDQAMPLASEVEQWLAGGAK